jgi:hypothetical protein
MPFHNRQSMICIARRPSRPSMLEQALSNCNGSALSGGFFH